MQLAEHIFRQYDIRGIVDEDLTPAVAEAVGRAYASELRARLPDVAPRVAVGEDNRPSSPGLRAGLERGLRSAGCGVVRLGTVPTPVTYFSEYEFAADGAVQITGSHNPPEYNGIKMTMGKASIHGDDIQRLQRRILERDLAVGTGSLEDVDPLPAYVADVSARFRLSRPLKVVVDCGNGTGSVVAQQLLESVGLEVIPLYCESDGTFPNHHPDPTVDRHVQDLIGEVRRHEADAGIGFDGDADRIGVVDDRGRIVRGDILLLLFGLDILKRHGPGQRLVFDVKCSQVLPEEFARAGGEPLMWKTGHSLIKEKMRETGALVAGELSGHVCFADDYYGFDDALYAACRLATLIADGDRPLSRIVGALPACVATPELRIEVAEEDKFPLVERAVEHFSARYDVISVDGVRVQFGDGWGLIRASNTQPVIVARFEAASAERLRQIRATMEDWLRQEGVHI